MQLPLKATALHYLIFFSSSNNLGFKIFICVPFIPKDLDSITPALSNFLNAFTITLLVIPTLSAILDATSNPSVPPNSLKICSTASSSEYDNVPIANWTTALL